MTITMNSRSSIVGLIPSMIGHQPDNTFTLLLSMPGGEAVMIVPPPTVDEDGEVEGQVHAWAYAVVKTIPDSATGIRVVQWVPVGENPSLAPSLATLSTLTDYMDCRHRDEFATNGMWMFTLDGQRIPVDYSEVDRVKAELAFTVELDATPPEPEPGLVLDVEAMTRVGELIGDAPAPTALEQWRNSEILWAHMRLDGEESLSEAEVARLCVALNDIRVRDTVMFRMGVWGNVGVFPHADFTNHLVRAYQVTPPVWVDAIGTVLGLVLWMRGDIVEAARALERVSPDYNLGKLTRMLLMAASPDEFRAGLASLTEEECRTGKKR